MAAVAFWTAAQTFAADSTTSADKKDVSFIKEAAQGGQAEVEMGRLAAEKGQNAQIKQLGQRLQQDHAKANQELTQIAQKSGVALPSEPNRKENHMAERLQNKTGAEFDKAFAEHALTDHEKDIRKYQKALQDTHDPELRAFIEKSLPVLRQHLEMARTAGSAVGVDQKALTAADRFLSSQGGQTSSSDLNRSSSSSRSQGTGATSQSGTGVNRSSTDPDHNK